MSDHMNLAPTFLDDAKRPRVPCIEWSRRQCEDSWAGPPDKQDEAFWPNKDPDAPGYVPPERFEEEHAKAVARAAAYDSGEWSYIGVVAQAVIYLPVGAAPSFVRYVMRSPGVWGVESDCDEAHLESIYQEERDELLGHLKALGAFVATLEG